MLLKQLFNKTLFTISLGKLEFKPGLIPTFATVAFLYLLISLGQWQLSRAEYKENIQTLINDRQNLPPIDYELAPTNIDEQLYLPVNISGYFDTNHQILLDNRVVNHAAGYDVYTPFIMNNGKAILINRGWVKQGRTRARKDLPDLHVETRDISIKGLLKKPPQPTIVLAENVNNFFYWPAVVQYVDLVEIETALTHPVEPMVLLLDGGDKNAFHREPLEFKTNSAKHLGYAFQWFGLAIALLVIYFGVNTNRKVIKHE